MKMEETLPHFKKQGNIEFPLKPLLRCAQNQVRDKRSTNNI